MLTVVYSIDSLCCSEVHALLGLKLNGKISTFRPHLNDQKRYIIVLFLQSVLYLCFYH